MVFLLAEPYLEFTRVDYLELYPCGDPIFDPKSLFEKTSLLIFKWSGIYPYPDNSKSPYYCWFKKNIGYKNL